MNNYSPLRVGIFYDGNFLLHASNYYNYIHAHHSRLSIGGLHQYVRKRVAIEESIEERFCQIVEAHYFRGRINATEASQRGNQLYNDRVFEDILMAEGVHTHYLPLRNLSGRKEERGIDVWLSLEVFQMALQDKIDVAVLIVSDTDYMPLLRKLGSLGVRTMLLAWDFEYTNDEGTRMVTKTSHELMHMANYPIAMHEEIERGRTGENPEILGIFVENSFAAAPSVDATVLRSSPGELLTSTILSIKNGFGFVRFPNNNLFFHQQDVIDGEFADLNPGDVVQFTIDKNQMKQDVAKNVRKIAEAEV